MSPPLFVLNLYAMKTPDVMELKQNLCEIANENDRHIVGAFLFDKDRQPLYTLATSESLWERRIAVMSTFHFIRNNEFGETLQIAQLLLTDPHDLIHKAVGWMLREIGNRNSAVEETFLKKHYRTMPRTMLRYAIEKFPPEKRRAYLKGMM